MGSTIISIKTVLLIFKLVLRAHGNNGTCQTFKACVDGVILPKWTPVKVELADSVIRAIIYLFAMLYAFLGVSIIADKFMAAIETITSQEREVNVMTKTGENVVFRVRVWNDTVSNLTLMALGSSAPEILLSVIEVTGKNFEAGTLGPGTIIGSAAFNLFIIIGICILVIPKGEVRKIQHLPVFAVTATFSVMAYVWLYLIIAVISVGVVDIWEAVITFLLFPITVIVAYLADRRFFIEQFIGQRRFVSRRNAINETGGVKILKESDNDVKIFEELREQYICTIRELRKDHPGISLLALEIMAINLVTSKSQKSRAFYKIMTNRMLTGSGAPMNISLSRRISTLSEESDDGSEVKDVKVQRIFFDPCHYTVMENVGVVLLTVRRVGGYLGSTVYVNYKTKDDTAIAGQDYLKVKGTLVFYPFETEKIIEITIIDDDIFEEDEHFTVKLSNIRVKNGKENLNYKYEISKTNGATIMILDDDHSGIFYFDQEVVEVPESCGTVLITVQRSTGARGIVRVPYKTMDGTAKNGSDYSAQLGYLIFKNEETSKTIEIDIFDDGSYAKNDYFLVRLGYPKLMDKVRDKGLPKLGLLKEMKVVIRENKEFRGFIDKLLRRSNLSQTFATSTWREQFQDAVSVTEGDLDENGKEQMPSLLSYVLNYLCLFWKLLFACVPPTEYLGGWLSFFVSVFCIGVLTTILGDLASSFGCSIGLLDEVTAITLVAIGTSVPDTFASKVAAINDSTADASIGNVTGSNAVNVFLGIGIAWTLASVVHASRGTVFVVPIGSMGFSVTVFCILALFAIAVIVARRHKTVGGELGGPSLYRYLSAGILFGFFFIYAILSSLKAYCHI